MASDGDAVVYCGGINMSNNQAAPDAGSSAGETLDGYEEGTFSPVVADAASGGTAMTMHSVATGYYTKIGNMVHIRGLPFTSRNADGNTAGIAFGSMSSGNYTAGMNPGGFITTNAAHITLGLFDTTGGSSQMQASEWTDDGEAVISCTYTAAT